ncbi:hypothetical protein HYG87_08215 [Methanobacterium alkalithermotolerans]|uniref:Uncharacterized protein n=1 Tax=Methanobacterium alkalithermotolerans TaxID=2731220 RepID=A0A8T8K7D7_9EURY|nr:hypothetical protein [Methanobacterium alkalithermotolerans]QUH23742.1 hypothetical protein HYG87_08215 [Methanobacterium alkalithermotolerans]RJS48139.1 MAG: hypothetical protein CIT03_09760 [Methanobacterium sp.]
MKKSRLNLFKVTSMSISVLGVLMIVATILIFAYIGVDLISSSISSSVDSGSAYDQLAVLKTDLSTLEVNYDSAKTEAYRTGNNDIQKQYVTAELELVKARSAVGDVESALSANLPAEEVQNRIGIANTQLRAAEQALADLRARF